MEEEMPLSSKRTKFGLRARSPLSSPFNSDVSINSVKRKQRDKKMMMSGIIAGIFIGIFTIVALADSNVLVVNNENNLPPNKELSSYENERDVNARTSYNLETVQYTQKVFGGTLMMIIFDPSTGLLYTRGNLNKRYNLSRGYHVSYVLSKALYKNFPDRFQKGGEPFQLLFTVADLPPIRAGAEERACLDKGSPDYYNLDCPTIVNSFAPIVTFGSAFRDPTVLPTLWQFPLMPIISCFFEHCLSTLQFVNGQLQYKDLIPQIIWRGSDFPTGPLENSMFGDLMPGHYFRDVEPDTMNMQEVADGLLRHFNQMTPRWKAVSLSLKASLDGELPWIDAKFLKSDAPSMYSKLGIDSFIESFDTRNIPIRTTESMDEDEMGKYKYQIDIGGGSGTTWSGTLRKLAMPGLLLHHTSPTKDFFHNEIRPWVHYVPLNLDLSDLREKYDWAESHPVEAEKIAKAGQDYVSQMRTENWIQATYEKYFVHRLGQIISAYAFNATGETIEEYRAQYKNHDDYLTCNIKGCQYSDKLKIPTTKRYFNQDLKGSEEKR